MRLKYFLKLHGTGKNLLTQSNRQLCKIHVIRKLFHEESYNLSNVADFFGASVFTKQYEILLEF